jgi:uncharacterized protein (TIGR03032 family)
MNGPDHTTAASPGTDDLLACAVSEGFVEWLASFDGSIAITTYQAGKVVLVGWDGRQVTVLPRHFDKPMGLAVDWPRLALATRHEVTLFADAPLLAPDYLEGQPGRYDALILPRAGYYTGDLHVHDTAFGADGLWVVATRFSCLARLSAEYSFAPAWKPPFVSEVVPEDRCHLNGLAMAYGGPKYVTCLGEIDTPGGWRPNKAAGGVVVDVASGQVVLRGLSMPHSPRWHGGRLWVLNSGAGELLTADGTGGPADVVCTLPGYLRGLCFAGPYALVGLCQIRERHLFGGLPVQQRFPALRCGLAVIDLRRGTTAGLLEFTAGCTEVYDVQMLPGVRRPMLLNRDKEEVRQAFTAPGFSYWLRPGNPIPVPGPE